MNLASTGRPLAWIFHSRLETSTERLVGRGSRRAIFTCGARLGRSLALPDYEICGLVDGLLEPLSRCIRGTGERDLLRLRADASVQSRIDELADKCDQGSLTPDELSEYETYVRFGNFIAILQAKARLRRRRPAAKG